MSEQAMAAYSNEVQNEAEINRAVATRNKAVATLYNAYLGARADQGVYYLDESSVAILGILRNIGENPVNDGLVNVSQIDYENKNIDRILRSRLQPQESSR